HRRHWELDDPPYGRSGLSKILRNRACGLLFGTRDPQSAQRRDDSLRDNKLATCHGWLSLHRHTQHPDHGDLLRHELFRGEEVREPEGRGTPWPTPTTGANRRRYTRRLLGAAHARHHVGRHLWRYLHSDRSGGRGPRLYPSRGNFHLQGT